MQHESIEQEKLFRWISFVRGKYPELDLMFHIPNGGKRNAKEAYYLKKQGVKSGVPDLFLPVSRHGYHGLFIEMKFGKNKTTLNQKKYIIALKEQGYAVNVCYGWESAQRVIEKYMQEKNNNE